jgi:hypothetical protein
VVAQAQGVAVAEPGRERKCSERRSAAEALVGDVLGERVLEREAVAIR